MPGVDDPLKGLRTVVVHGRGLSAWPTLPALLHGVQLRMPAQADRGADAVLAWGLKPSAERAEAWARERGLPLIRLEDGFVRSIGLGPDAPPLSLVLDDRGIYYDARQPSRLDALIRRPLDAAETARGQALQRRWCEQRVSKYNAARDAVMPVEEGDVLVVDQTRGDASILHGQADATRFAQMLEAALDEHPRARIWLKVHPDVLAGRKRGHFEALSAAQARRVTVLRDSAHPAALLPQMAAVYTVTSQMGFEALLWGRPVRCFGLPFYAGWGLTQDALPAPSWRGRASLAQLTHAALVDYARCIDARTLQPCPVEALIDWVGLQRRQRQRFAPEVVAVGFSAWKRPIAEAFFAGSQVHFQGPRKALPPDCTLALWGRRELPPSAQAQAPAQVVRLEDGFLRSVGLGADLVRPLSWVMDRQGIYYDASQRSDLEDLLQQTTFSPELLSRARHLRERILDLGLTKYNVGKAAWQRPDTRRPVVLVVGQVEADAAIRHGAPTVAGNLALVQAVRQRCPEAHLIYKPHPDVVAQLREPGHGEAQVVRHCDEVIVNAPMDRMLRLVDEVHVMTSLAGFEALLRGRRVVTWGVPFYAGWGLTEDQQPVARRVRRLSLDELVAGVLLLYPTYVSRRSGQFCTPEEALEELQQWRDIEGEAPAANWRRQAWRWAWRVGRRLRGG